MFRLAKYALVAVCLVGLSLSSVAAQDVSNTKTELQEIDQKRRELELARLENQIAKLKDETSRLTVPLAPPEVNVPAPVMPNESSASLGVSDGSKDSSELAPIMVLAIQGIDGKNSATISYDGQAVMDVYEGSVLPNGSKVQKITSYSVNLFQDGAVVQYPVVNLNKAKK